MIDSGALLTACDGVDARDITGNGLADILLGLESGICGWYEHTSLGVFSARKSIQATGVGTKHESSAWIDVDGDGNYEVVRADQGAGTIRIHKQDTPGSPGGTWSTAVILTGRANIQFVGGFDIDGDGREEIVYAFEGSGAGNGGVGWLDWQSGDVADSGNYVDHVMVQRDGAWWAGPARDFSGNGHGLDILFSARNLRNGSADPGVFWLEKPVDPTDPWTEHTIIASAADWTRIDAGNFFGNEGVDTDVLASQGAESPVAKFFLFDSSNDWALTEVETPEETRRNSRRAGHTHNGRDAIITCSLVNVRLWRWSGSAWTNYKSFAISGSKIDNRIPIINTDGVGYSDLVLADSNRKELYILKL